MNVGYSNMESSIRGFHQFHTIWNPVLGQLLNVTSELHNAYDPYAMKVVTVDNLTVGHLPYEISHIFHFFEQRGGSIQAEVNGNARASPPEVKGTEIPCILHVFGRTNEVQQIPNLLENNKREMRGWVL